MKTRTQVMAALACFPMLSAAMCSTTTPAPEPRIVIQRVEIPVPIECATTIVREPLPDPDFVLSQTPEIDDKVGLVLAGREIRDLYIEKLEAALEGCGAKFIGGSPAPPS
jgi:hypothetical protein